MADSGMGWATAVKRGRNVWKELKEEEKNRERTAAARAGLKGYAEAAGTAAGATPEQAPAQATAQSPVQKQSALDLYRSQLNAQSAEIDEAARLAKEEQERIRLQGDRQAQAGLDRLGRYLTQTQYMDGLSGSGMAESNRVAAYNALLNRQTANTAQYADAVREIDKSANEQKSGLRAAYNQQEYAKRLGEEQNEQAIYYEDIYNQMEEMAADAMGVDDKISESDYNEIQAWLESKLPQMTEFQRSRITQWLESAKRKVRTADQQTLYEYNNVSRNDGTKMVNGSITNGKYKTGYNFKVADENGNQYDVQLGEAAEDKGVLTAAQNHKDGDVWAYRGSLYMSRAGVTYIVDRRATSAKGYNALLKLYYPD